MTKTRRGGYSVAVNSKRLEPSIERILHQQSSGQHVEQSEVFVEEEQRDPEGEYEQG